ncbi:hypothetical protein KBZ07_07930 [Cyanobium sp. BA20m-14]|uniref:hypothetical protein n=1 Tax=Cyanobium sp. BA20m-14 TaxID=2823703 RepID=UPI0020CBEBA1|nr:hypothetical protein [Cyanobium sp. BA20m-14]MCP9913335.1 hypothetical protein [Cyanobium sp. BA20m-14]
MAWIPLNNRSAELRSALERWKNESGSTAEMEEQYNQQDFGLLSEAQLLEQITPAAAAPASTNQAPPAPRLREGDAFETPSLRYLRNTAETAEDRRWADTLHDSMLLELWLQHVTETGDTYYPPLAEDLFQSYQLQEDGHHS